MSRANGKQNGLIQPKEELTVKYMHKPPTIPPNYGNQKRTLLPKSKISRVLLYDNATQDHMLGIKLANINIEKERANRINNLHKRLFFSRQKKKQKHAQKIAENAAKAGTSLPCITTHDKRDERQPTNSQALSGKMPSLYEEDFKLPDIIPDKRRMIFKVKDVSGGTRVYHTVDDDGLFGEIVPLHTFYDKLTDDPRFQGLKDSLVPAEADDVF